MLRKLLKHEFRATSRKMLTMYLIVLVASLGANLTTRGLLETQYKILDAIGVVLVMAFAVAIIAVCVMALVTMVERFGRNLLGDEGYLSMTLPVTVHQQVWAKLLTSIVWFAATAVVVVLAFCIMAFDLSVVKQFLNDFGALFREVWQHMSAYYALNGTAILVEGLVLAFCGLAAACLRFYAAMSIGYSFANYKMPLAVVFFFVIGAVEQFLTVILMIVADRTGLDVLLANLTSRVEGDMAAVHLVMIAMIAMIASQIAVSAVFYFITTYFLKNRLNLE